MNALTIDLESWVHIKHTDLDSNERKKIDDSYILTSTNHILKFLKKYYVKTTFFILGEIYDWYPSLIENISSQGHEIAYHTHDHQNLSTEEVLIEQLELSKNFIDNYKPKGFRAPEAFIKKPYLSILKDHCFDYDSSIYFDYKKNCVINGVKEIPVSTYPILKIDTSVTFPRNLSLGLMLKEIPFGSGYLFSILGSRLSWFINRLNRQDKPAILFIHPWQIIDPPKGWRREVFSLYSNPIILPYLVNCQNIFFSMLSKHEFTTISDIMECGWY